MSLGSQITGTVKQVPVAEGQAVAAGQTQIELEGTEPEASSCCRLIQINAPGPARIIFGRQGESAMV